MRFDKRLTGCAPLKSNRISVASGALAFDSIISAACENTTTTSTTTCSLPSTPLNLEIEEIEAQYISIVWGLAAGATHYEVWRSTNGGAYELIVTITGNELADFGIDYQNTYCYKVRSLNQCGYSDFSNQVCHPLETTTTSTPATTTSTTSTTTVASTTTTSTTTVSTTTTSTTTCAIPDVPEFNIGVLGNCSYRVTWAIPAGADSVTVRLHRNGVLFSSQAFGSPTTQADFELSSGFEWCFSLRACNDCGCSQFSDQSCVSCPTTTTTTTSTTTCGILDTPAITGFEITETLENGCSTLLEWTNPEGATVYVVEYETQCGGGGETVFRNGGVSSPDGEDEFGMPECGCFLRARVKVGNGCSESEWSEWTSFLECVCATTTTTTEETTSTTTPECGIVNWMNSPPGIGEGTFWQQQHFIDCLGVDPELVTTYVDGLGNCYEFSPFPEGGPTSYQALRVECP